MGRSQGIGRHFAFRFFFAFFAFPFAFRFTFAFFRFAFPFAPAFPFRFAFHFRFAFFFAFRFTFAFVFHFSPAFRFYFHFPFPAGFPFAFSSTFRFAFFRFAFTFGFSFAFRFIADLDAPTALTGWIAAGGGHRWRLIGRVRPPMGFFWTPRGTMARPSLPAPPRQNLPALGHLKMSRRAAIASLAVSRHASTMAQRDGCRAVPSPGSLTGAEPEPAHDHQQQCRQLAESVRVCG